MSYLLQLLLCYFENNLNMKASDDNVSKQTRSELKFSRLSFQITVIL
jgi:hypothetical protein